jgi:hypothetical protein
MEKLTINILLSDNKKLHLIDRGGNILQHLGLVTKTTLSWKDLSQEFILKVNKPHEPHVLIKMESLKA